MLKTATIVTGLPGSGKTTWCRAQQARHSLLVIIDDPMVNKGQWNKITSQTDHVLISDPNFCVMAEHDVLHWVGQHTTYLDHTTYIQWVVLENRLHDSYQRCTHKAAGFAQRLHKNFNVPQHAYHVQWNALTDWHDILENTHVVRQPSP